MGGAYFSQPWRAVTASHQDNLDFVESYKPLNRDVKNLRIMLHGPVGSGKSSFINSVESVLQGRITRRALTDTISRGYCTKKYTAYKIHKGRDRFYSFIFNDIMGFEKMTNRGVNVEDVKLAMKGHVPDGYKFDPEVQFQDDDDDYNSCPTLDDRVHVLVCVVPADNVSLMSPEVVKKMREVREAASEMGIPQLAILTKVDKAYPQLATDINEVYNHKDLKQKVDKLSMLIGMPPNCFFLVKNYHSETNTNEDIDALILKALREIITFGEDFLNNL